MSRETGESFISFSLLGPLNCEYFKETLWSSMTIHDEPVNGGKVYNQVEHGREDVYNNCPRGRWLAIASLQLYLVTCDESEGNNRNNAERQ